MKVVIGALAVFVVLLLGAQGAEHASSHLGPPTPAMNGTAYVTTIRLHKVTVHTETADGTETCPFSVAGVTDGDGQPSSLLCPGDAELLLAWEVTHGDDDDASYNGEIHGHAANFATNNDFHGHAGDVWDLRVNGVAPAIWSHEECAPAGTTTVRFELKEIDQDPDVAAAAAALSLASLVTAPAPPVSLALGIASAVLLPASFNGDDDLGSWINSSSSVGTKTVELNGKDGSATVEYSIERVFQLREGKFACGDLPPGPVISSLACEWGELPVPPAEPIPGTVTTCSPEIAGLYQSYAWDLSGGCTYPSPPGNLCTPTEELLSIDELRAKATSCPGGCGLGDADIAVYWGTYAEPLAIDPRIELWVCQFPDLYGKCYFRYLYIVHCEFCGARAKPANGQESPAALPQSEPADGFGESSIVPDLMIPEVGPLSPPDPPPNQTAACLDWADSGRTALNQIAIAQQPHGEPEGMTPEEFEALLQQSRDWVAGHFDFVLTFFIDEASGYTFDEASALAFMGTAAAAADAGDYYGAVDNYELACLALLTAEAPTPIPTPTPGPSPTPTPTPSPTPSPTPTPGPELTQGDDDCDEDVDAVDALKTLQHVAAIPFQQEQGCPEVGGELPAAAPAGEPPTNFGDVDCDADVDAVDALKILQFVAAIPFSQNDPCTDIGQPL